VQHLANMINKSIASNTAYSFPATSTLLMLDTLTEASYVDHLL